MPRNAELAVSLHPARLSNADPRRVPRLPLDGLAAGSIEVIVDEWTAMVKGSLGCDPAACYAQVAELLGAN